MRTRTSPSTVRSATFTINPPKAGLKRRPGPRPETLSGFTCTCKYSGVLEIHVDIIKFITELEITIIFEHWAVRRLSVSKSEGRSVLYYRYARVDYGVSGRSPCVFLFFLWTSLRCLNVSEYLQVWYRSKAHRRGMKLLEVITSSDPPRAKCAPFKIFKVSGTFKKTAENEGFFRRIFLGKINFQKSKRWR